MSLEEREYSTLIISASEKFTSSVIPYLKRYTSSPTVAVSGGEGKRCILEKEYDIVIVNSPLRDENGLKLAIDVSQGKNTVCLLTVKAEDYEDAVERAVDNGVFILSKPLFAPQLNQCLVHMAATLSRLRRMEKKSLSLEEKMEEIRLVNRAKWLLTENLKMTEPDAHRYIERQAMNTCRTKKEVSVEIINTYR